MSLSKKLLGPILLVLGLASTVFVAKPLSQQVVVLFGQSSGAPVPLSLSSTGAVNISSTAGSGTQAFKPSGVLYWENSGTATSAGSTTFVTSTVYSIPAGTLSTNGDMLHIQFSHSVGSSAADTKNYKCNIGYSSFDTATGVFTGGINLINANTGTNATYSVISNGYVTRTDATTAAFHSISLFENTSANQSTSYTTGSVTWANPNNFLCTVGNTTASNTVVMTLRDIRLIWVPR